MKLISIGAEAKIFSEDDMIIKERVSKGYRVEKVDIMIRKRRTKREAKVIGKLNDLKIPCPKLISVEKFSIKMSNINGSRLLDYFSKNPKKIIPICKEIGEHVREMHKASIIHGDLTLNNLIFTDKVNFIDFGLSYFSDKIEDKATDLYLLGKSLEIFDPKGFKEAFKAVVIEYIVSNKEGKKIVKRLHEIMKRGRHKQKNDLDFLEVY